MSNHDPFAPQKPLPNTPEMSAGMRIPPVKPQAPVIGPAPFAPTSAALPASEVHTGAPAPAETQPELPKAPTLPAPPEPAPAVEPLLTFKVVRRVSEESDTVAARVELLLTVVAAGADTPRAGTTQPKPGIEIGQNVTLTVPASHPLASAPIGAKVALVRA